VAGFADHSNDCPVILTLLNIAKRQGEDFRSPQSTSRRRETIAAVALLPKCFSGSSQGAARTPRAEPVANAPAEFAVLLHSPDTRNQFWAQQAGIGRLVCQTAPFS
jgi:hypothetical protein